MPEQRTSGRKAVLVLGMHRSGTSALGGVLAHLGVAPPASLIPAARDNPRGFWEGRNIVAFHEQLLATVGSSWSDWSAVDPARLAAGEAAGLVASLPDLIEQEFAQAPLFFVKDPRMCRLLEAWWPALERQSIQPTAILPVRHPMEVARSLNLRNRLGVAGGLLLWLRHVLEAEQRTRGIARAIVPYAALLADWRAQAERIAAELGLAWPVSPEHVATEIDGFLSAGLRHFSGERLEGALPAQLAGWVDGTFDALLQLAAGPSPAASDRLDAIHREFDAAAATFAVAFAERQAAHAGELEKLRKRLEAAPLPQARPAPAPAIDAEALGRQLAVGLAGKLAEMESRLRAREDVDRAEAARLAELVRATLADKEQVARQSAALARAVAEYDARLEAADQVRAGLRDKELELDALQRRFDQTRELHREEAARRRAINEELQQVISRQERLLAVMQERLRAVQAEHAVLERAGDAASAASGRELAQVRGELARREREARELATELAAIRRSRAWRMVMALRRALGRGAQGATRDPVQEQAALIEQSGLFDAAWYLAEYPDVAAGGMNPLRHYLEFGAKELRNPSKDFDTRAYLEANPDVAADGINPLFHYVAHGAREGRNGLKGEPA